MSRIEPPEPRVLPPNRLGELRVASGMKRAQIASSVNRDPQTLYRWEKGLAQIPDEAKHTLAELFGVSISWLMGWDEEVAA